MNALTPHLFRSVRPLGLASRRRLGFSAIEVTAVAAIIAVLALILVPLVNKRVDESKIAAAQDDMSAIQKAEELAFGFTGHYFRLCDLDRPTPDAKDTQAVKDLKIPGAYWNGPITMTSEKATLAKSWSGPYLQFHRSITLYELANNFPKMVYLYDNLTIPGGVGGGPIMLFTGDETDWLSQSNEDTNTNALHRRRYPVDPWGNPYLFFGSGLVVAASAQQGGGQPGKTALENGNLTPYNWPTAAVYSLGPDGLPGDVPMASVTDGLYYFREAEFPVGTPNSHPLGKNVNQGGTTTVGDDLSREF